jgi:RNA polymerase sigma factor (sigma-70 family)
MGLTPLKMQPDALTRGQAAMFDLFVRLSTSGRRFAEQHVGDDAADDVVQQAFLEVFDASFSDGEPPTHPVDALFFRILRNRCVDWLRHRDRHVRAPDRQGDSGVIELPAWVDQRNPAQVADGSMLSARVDEVIGHMPPEMQRVMTAGRQVGFESRPIAEATGMKHELVKWHLKQGRARLRRQLEQDGYEVPAQLHIGRPLGSINNGKRS